MQRSCILCILYSLLSFCPCRAAEIFDGWENPKVVLVFTGYLNGYAEPCGCAGIDNMKGGLARRITFFEQLEKKGWNYIAVDAGNLNKGGGRQEELKYNFLIDEAYRQMNYAAAGIGPRELLFPTETLLLYGVDTVDVPKRYTSANTAVIAFSPDFVPPYRMIEKNGVRVLFVSVLGQSFLKENNNPDIKTADAVMKLKEVTTGSSKLIKILSVFGTADEIAGIIKKFPDEFDFILPSTTPAEPPLKPQYSGKTMLVETGEKGRYVVAAGLFEDGTVKYERVPIDSRFANSAKMTVLMKMYQDELQRIGLEGLGIRRSMLTQRYLGSASCLDCHEKSAAVWKKSQHASAWQTLNKGQGSISRQHDPECIACHVTGWNTRECLPETGGFWSEKDTPQLTNVNCESCHGAGAEHVQAEKNSDKTLQEKFRLSVRLPLKEAKQKCMTCHDGENSPKFDFDAYWKKIEHKENDIL